MKQSGTPGHLEQRPDEVRRGRLPPAMAVLAVVVIIGVALLFVYALVHGSGVAPNGSEGVALSPRSLLKPTIAPGAQFVCPLNGATVTNPVTLRMAIAGVRYAPAASPAKYGEGHLDLIIDGPAPPPGQVVPQDDTHIRLDDGSYVTIIPDLSPGAHTVTLVFVDSNQVVPRDPALTDAVNITVAQNSDQATANCATP